MKDIYDGEAIAIQADCQWYTSMRIMEQFDKSVQRMEEVQRELEAVKGKMVADNE